ncbi:MAG TPA: hypothetical protein VNX68_18720 [Nitrosopumilaceae archaeon]|jgi:hypothetical protein|nr:hypothetical protein [Nitrosopumilaceae archaeon]
MSAPQINIEILSHKWYSLTYQSNEIINEKMHHQVKKFIAELLISNFTIKDIRSYIHGNIIFAIDTNNPVNIFRNIIEAIRSPLVNNAPPLLFSINLIAQKTDNEVYLYIYGSDDMNAHFRTSILSVFP